MRKDLSRPITRKKTEAVTKNLPKRKSPGSDGFMGIIKYSERISLIYP